MSDDPRPNCRFYGELLDGEIAVWIDEHWDGAIRARTSHGDPVELRLEDLLRLRDVLDRAIDVVRSEPGL